MVKVLLERGADPKLCDEDGMSAYDMAKGAGQIACAELLNPKALKSAARNGSPSKCADSNESSNKQIWENDTEGGFAYGNLGKGGNNNDGGACCAMQ